MAAKKLIMVIGGGAAGFFSAINVAVNFPESKVIILEKSNKLLSKVKVSGGGRCNVTHHCFEINELIRNYPRGGKELRQVFSQFSVQDTIDWFLKRGVKLKTEPDGRMFPESNSSETIINCFLSEVQRLDISVNINEEVLSIEYEKSGRLNVKTSRQSYMADAVICSIGGHNQLKNYDFLKKCGHNIDELIPSLFTLNLPQSHIRELMGLSVKNGTVKVIGTKHQYTGPVLITHWGLSGPAVLKLSAFAANDFFKLNYQAGISVNWTGTFNEEQLKEELSHQLGSKALIVNTPLFEMPKRLWEYLILRSDISLSKPWIELGKKQLNKLAQVLCNDIYDMHGKTTFKEEFVTSGGINLKEVNFKTMESKLIPGLFFCGEVLNIDGITGGFNFQNAWSTAWIAAKNALN
ncbi:MAG: aminoacetone oxidase family FAD-binding enzyme [Bacteroidetes bacterium]|jgi:predicted Rossmann fold flavoprotein|nr:aminoacetone oxidase family FAD-binding enzyme [Bacteroidota bacterium]MDF2453581.1 aminoacetone oxidase family FAD-binding enzyme [Bacteroidota bacterium]